ncbi:MAG: site-2 protease family protein [Planctomycetales bacterium]|nr:site-2 protease family protein [Planctomycetales bacterium]
MDESSAGSPDSATGEPEDKNNFLTDDVEPATVVPVELPVDDATATVLAKLDQLQSGKRNWTHAIVVLVLTLVLFGAAEFLRGNPVKLAWLIGVLLIHESGHFVGMKLFGYRDVRMFFIPFFGAAVSGRSLHVPGYQAALVILLGPLPGIVIGVVLGLVNLIVNSPTVGELSLLFIVLNGFNLLPFMPLDGGRLLQLVLFSRQRHLEAVFQVVTGLGLAVVGFAGSMWLLGGFGVLMVFGSGHSFRVRTIAQQMLQRLGGDWRAGLNDERVPQPIALQILDLVRARTPQLKDPKLLATTIHNVWERMHVRLPGALASVALLAVYGISLFGTVILWVVILLNQLKLGDIVPVEAPRGAAVHRLRIDESTIAERTVVWTTSGRRMRPDHDLPKPTDLVAPIQKHSG